PCVRTFRFENALRQLHYLHVQRDLAATLASERWNGHAPRALPRKVPVGPGLGHVADSLAGPSRNPLDPVDHGDHSLAQPLMIDAHEPLLGCTENERVVASPTMRIAVRERLRMKQGVLFAQALDDGSVGLEDVLARPLAALGGEPSRVVDRRERIEPVPGSDHEVLVAVTRGGMNQAGARVGGHVVAVHKFYITFEEWMTEDVLAVIGL